MKDESVALDVLGETLMFQANTDDVWVAVELSVAEPWLSGNLSCGVAMHGFLDCVYGIKLVCFAVLLSLASLGLVAMVWQ